MKVSSMIKIAVRARVAKEQADYVIGTKPGIEALVAEGDYPRAFGSRDWQAKFLANRVNRLVEAIEEVIDTEAAEFREE